MAIGRAEDRDTPWDPVMFNIARMFRSPIRVTHLSQLSDRPHTQAGHMTATDQTCFSCIKSLHARGPSIHGSRLSPGLWKVGSTETGNAAIAGAGCAIANCQAACGGVHWRPCDCVPQIDGHA